MEKTAHEKSASQHPPGAPDLRLPLAAPEPSTAGEPNECLPAIFWDGTEDWIDENNCADFAALHSLKTEETTPEERAASQKAKGNEALKFKKNKIYIRMAVQHYTLALQEPIQNMSLRSILHSNRAQAALFLGNFRQALMDSEESVRLNPGNEKGWFRAARSAYELEEFDRCDHFCRQGLLQVKDSAELRALLESAENRKIVELGTRNQRNKMYLQAKTYVESLHRRPFNFGSPQFGFGEHFPKLSNDGNSFDFWVVFIYPESMKTDVVECFNERSTFAEQLDQMFAECAPPLEWDTAFEYKRETLELYYCSNLVNPYPMHVLKAKIHEANHKFDMGNDKSSDDFLEEVGVDPIAAHLEQHIRLVDEGRTLFDILSADDHIISGHPTFFVLSKGTRFRDLFLKEWKSFLDKI